MKFILLKCWEFEGFEGKNGRRKWIKKRTDLAIHPFLKLTNLTKPKTYEK